MHTRSKDKECSFLGNCPHLKTNKHGLSLGWSSPNRLWWSDSEPQESPSAPPTPVMGLQAWAPVPRFTWFWGANSDPRVWVGALR